MKSKTEKIALIFSIFLVIFYLVVGISAVIFGIKFIKNRINIVKDSITAEKFVTAMTEEGFDVNQLEKNIEMKKLKVKEAYKAKKDDYEIEFYTFENNDDATDFYKEGKDKINSNSATKSISLSGKNYATYTLVKNGKYYFMERINNTVVLVYGNSRNEKDATKVLSLFGY